MPCSLGERGRLALVLANPQLPGRTSSSLCQIQKLCQSLAEIFLILDEQMRALPLDCL